MSLEVDGTWKAGLWNPTVWLLGVWQEGEVEVEEEEDIGGVLHKHHNLSPLIKWLKKEQTLVLKPDKEVLEKVEKVIDLGLMSNAELLDERRKAELLTLIYIIIALDF